MGMDGIPGIRNQELLGKMRIRMSCQYHDERMKESQLQCSFASALRVAKDCHGFKTDIW